MNKYINKVLVSGAFALVLLGIASCTDYLNKSPLSDINSNDSFKNFTNFQGFTEELYNCIPIMSAHDYHNSWNYGEEELWETTASYAFGTRIDQGDYWAWTSEGTGWFMQKGDDDYTYSQTRGDKKYLWGLSWYGIRKANIGLANLDKLTEATDEGKRLIAGQLYFFRGWFYFMLMQYWGGLPYISTVLSPEEQPRLPRLSYQATADSIAEDFRKAADLLPVNWDQTDIGLTTKGNNNFRANKIMALAYLGKNYLWAGSPLMNQESTGSKSYNTAYCKKAADAFAEALQLTESTGRYALADFSQWTDLFYIRSATAKVPGLKESIFMENICELAARWRWNMVNDFRPQAINTSGVKVYPTANYVDNYGMKNGLPIKDPTVKDPESGYDPEYPWKNRDPRFYKDIVFDAVKCTNNGKGNQTADVQYASLYTGGTYRTSGAAKGVVTGYMNTKLCPPLMNDDDGYKENNCLALSFMRLSDVYLMYAEATAWGYGSPQSAAGSYSLKAYEAVNKVRARAGVGNLADKYLNDNDSFMSELRRERAVELAFEGHRFVDLRRWLLLTESPYTLKKSVEFDRANDVAASALYANPQNARVKNLREVVLLERHLSVKHYWFPLPKADVNMYKEFKQNPGW